MAARTRSTIRDTARRTGRPTRHVAAAALLAVCATFAAACGGPEPASTTDTPGMPLVGLTDAERARFLLGRALFERLATPEEGLGPLYNADRCSTCHDEPATGGGGTRVLVLKATAWLDGQCSTLMEYGGDNIQLRATPLLLSHGLGPETVPTQATATAFVSAPPLFGLGLLEAVPEETLVALADPSDDNGDGISGRVPRSRDGRIARFGRKADAVSVADFVDTALRFELGLTTLSNPFEERRNGEPIPAAADPMPDPEMDGPTVAILTDYVRLLAPPATQDAPAAADTLRQGEAVFEEIGCGRCHIPELTTGPAPEAALAHKRIRPFTDLLLHDLGSGSSDTCTHGAAPGEYRTAPLWGLRYRSRYLHDASAGSLEDAIDAHGGEAGGVVAAFHDLAAERRRVLLRFLSSL
ncbi:MAG TPA: di-heme oxidoredictase family protein [Longimicrobiales bacterium]|nr:di-heme oxidoredictase family protein [Longimicrobiales bacterium]